MSGTGCEGGGARGCLNALVPARSVGGLGERCAATDSPQERAEQGVIGGTSGYR